MEFNSLLWEKTDNVGIVSINRPKQLNALNNEVYQQLYRLFQSIENDPETRVVIITGSGDKAFAAGTDISSMVSLSSREAAQFVRELRKTCGLICSLRKPVIAAINGYALGGGLELALCADLRIASDQARFGQPEINLGIIPGSGGTQRLARLIGVARAKQMIYYGEMIDAVAALDWGLINAVVPANILREEAMTWAKRLLAKSDVSLGLAKTSIDSGIETDINTGLEIEHECFAQCFAAEDQREGMQAFLEKRKPQFKNR
jgi:enoyl-CoA hydratase